MKLLLYLTVISALSSCYAYKIYPKEDRDFEYTGEKRSAFVVNREMKHEFAILRKSRIFNFTNDSLSKNVIKIRLNKLGHTNLCGMPIMASLFTLGQVPVYFPDRYFFSFEELDGGERIERKYELKVEQRYWFWDLFTFDKSFRNKAGKALLANYYKPSTDGMNQ